MTWWPLFRDCVYYAIGLLVLAVFVGVVTPEQITWWEAFVLFLMYIGYIYVMSKNEDLYNFFSRGKSGERQESMTVVDSFRSVTFRAGLLTLIREPGSWIDRARIGFVAKISGNVDDVFDFVDENGDGEISRQELKKCFEKIEGDEQGFESTSDEELDQIIADIDTDKNGKVSSLFLRYLEYSFL